MSIPIDIFKDSEFFYFISAAVTYTKLYSFFLATVHSEGFYRGVCSYIIHSDLCDILFLKTWWFYYFFSACWQYILVYGKKRNPELPP